MTPEVHPAALLFPMMTEDELAALADDIAANGLLEPVVLYHGQILDGRNRLAACKLADVKPHFEEVNGDVPSPTIYVLSKNLHRRHLSVSQRAAIAADVVPMLQKESHQRQISSLKNQPHSSLAPLGANDTGKSTEIAAKELQVGTRTVERAVAVKRDHPEVFERVKRGEITVGEASREHDKRPSHGASHAESYEPKTDRQKQLAEGQKERMVRALSTITGLCRGLGEMDIRKAVAVCDEEERQTWIDRAKDLSSQLHKFAGKLQKGF